MAVRPGQLRRDPGDARRERVLRSRARRVHRSRAGATGRAPARRRRHALPGRDRGPAAVAAGEAAPRGAGPRGAAARRQQRPPRRRADRRGVESRPLEMVEAGAFRRDLFYRLRVLTIRFRRCASGATTCRCSSTHFVPRFNAGTERASPCRRPRAAPAPRAPLAGQRPRARELARVAAHSGARDGTDLATVLRSARSASGGFWADERTRILRVLERPPLEPAARGGRARHLARHALAPHGAPRHSRPARRRRRNVLSAVAATRAVPGRGDAATAPARHLHCSVIPALPPAHRRRIRCSVETDRRRRRNRRGPQPRPPRRHRPLGRRRPLVYRVTINDNDLDSVEGLAPPGQPRRALVQAAELQRRHRPTAPITSRGARGRTTATPIYLGPCTPTPTGKWRIANLRSAGTSVMLFPPSASHDVCRGGLFTELLPRACDGPGWGCTAWTPPTMHWLNVQAAEPEHRDRRWLDLERRAGGNRRRRRSERRSRVQQRQRRRFERHRHTGVPAHAGDSG